MKKKLLTGYLVFSLTVTVFLMSLCACGNAPESDEDKQKLETPAQPAETMPVEIDFGKISAERDPNTTQFIHDHEELAAAIAYFSQWDEAIEIRFAFDNPPPDEAASDPGEERERLDSSDDVHEWRSRLNQSAKELNQTITDRWTPILEELGFSGVRPITYTPLLKASIDPSALNAETVEYLAGFPEIISIHLTQWPDPIDEEFAEEP